MKQHTAESALRDIQAWDGNVHTSFDLLQRIERAQNVLGAGSEIDPRVKEALGKVTSAEAYQNHFLMEGCLNTDFPVWAVDHEGAVLAHQLADQLLDFSELPAELRRYIDPETGEVARWFEWCVAPFTKAELVQLNRLKPTVQFGQQWFTEVEELPLKDAIANTKQFLRQHEQQHGGTATWADVWSDSGIRNASLCPAGKIIIRRAIHTNGKLLASDLAKVAWLNHELLYQSEQPDLEWLNVGLIPRQRATFPKEEASTGPARLSPNDIQACKELAQWWRTGLLDQQGELARQANSSFQAGGDPRVAEKALLERVVFWIADGGLDGSVNNN